MHTNSNEPKRNAGEYQAPNGDIGSYPQSGPESVNLGYETTDVNVGGIIVFLAGLLAFVLIFFGFCFVMGKAINTGLAKQDGPTDQWHRSPGIASGENGGKRENLKSNSAIEQQELANVTTAFPNPRLDIDDGNQGTADLHAREDLLLDHYSGEPGSNTVRIPIERAIELIAQRGLSVASQSQAATEMAGDHKPSVQVPLTSGFARTGYELDTIQAREQQMEFKHASSASHAQLQQPANPVAPSTTR